MRRRDCISWRAFLPPLLAAIVFVNAITIVVPAHHSQLVVVAAIGLRAALVGLVAIMSLSWQMRRPHS
jgi:hypothetical protein